MSSHQMEVHIMGQSYLLKCPTGGEAQFQAAVHKVDAAMCKIRDAGKIKARERIAVLAALNLAYQLAERGPVREAAAGEVDVAALLRRIGLTLAVAALAGERSREETSAPRVVARVDGRTQGVWLTVPF